MFKKQTGDIASTATVKPAGYIDTAGEQMSDGSMDYLAKNKAKSASDVGKIKRKKIKH